MNTTDLHRAASQGDVQRLRELLSSADYAAVDAYDPRGMTPLMMAAEAGDADAIGLLLDAGAQVDRMQSRILAARSFAADLEVAGRLLEAGLPFDDMTLPDQTALSFAASPQAARRLLEAGADPQYLPREMRRALLGLAAEPDDRLLTVSADTFLRERHRRFGAVNPELATAAFWYDMVRSGVSGFQAEERLAPSADDEEKQPVWCAQRFGQSFTWLPDGRVIQIAGEHEDSYDPDFCIYNDVFVHEPDGSFGIYGYPADDFPPTDFHTATRVGSSIVIIGSLGYRGTRQFGSTPVFVLDTATLRIDRLSTMGEPPGWIYRHSAVLVAPEEIRVTGGLVVTQAGDGEDHVENSATHVLDLAQRVWRRIG